MGKVNERAGAVTLSIVSHGQKALVEALLLDLVGCNQVEMIVLTLNVDEPAVEVPELLRERLVFVHNLEPKGFGENHNHAFRQCMTPWFAVLNPDIRLPTDPFPSLIKLLAESGAAVCAPAVLSPLGKVEDNARIFPTPWGIIAKGLGLGNGQIRYRLGDVSFAPDWVGGMFLLFRHEDYQKIGGFDPGFFLYYEDVDLCARLHKAGSGVLFCPTVHVIHDARRSSRQSMRYLTWHLKSMFRFWLKHLGRLPTVIRP